MSSEDLPTLYLNENIAVQIADRLKEFNINSIHTICVGNVGVSDEVQLEYAATNNYILVTHNRKDFRKLHSEWQAKGKRHAGIIVLGCNKIDIIANRLKKFFDSAYSTITPPFCVSPPV